LGIPWHPKKWRDFASIFIYLGFLWNLTNHTVELPDEKREKYLNKIIVVLETIGKGGRLTCKEAMSINRTLSHVSIVILHGRAYLSNLSTFISQFSSSSLRFASRHSPKSVIVDLQWWYNTLSWSSPAQDLAPRGETQDIDMWVDASTDWGIGLLFGNRWNTWTLREGWKGNGHNIGWLKAIAVELAVLTLAGLGWKNTSVLIRSDNQGIIGAFKSG
jgi:hypothetical protein